MPRTPHLEPVNDDEPDIQAEFVTVAIQVLAENLDPSDPRHQFLIGGAAASAARALSDELERIDDVTIEATNVLVSNGLRRLGRRFDGAITDDTQEENS